MVNKVRVYGKAQNRTALGIINAYMVMYPHATLEDLQKAFPNQLNPDCGTKQIFMSEKDIIEHVANGEQWYTQAQGYFAKDDEWIILPDKTHVGVISMWTKPSFERLVEHAAQYGIEVAKFEEAEGGGKKGSFRLEYLNGYVPPKPVSKKGIPWWVWALIGVVVAGLIVALLCRPKGETQVITVTDTVVETVYVQQLEKIEDNYNAAEFQQGKADLGEDSKFVLHDLAKLMKQYPEFKLRIEGHTSAEGDAATNQKLSEARAQAAVDFLVDHEGMDANRLEAVGFGSSKPKNPDNPMAPENRRTEFEIIK